MSCERSEGMLVALGAQITISEFVAGRTAQRLVRACDWLNEWCEKASARPLHTSSSTPPSGHSHHTSLGDTWQASAGVCSPSCNVFLFTSWLEARKVDVRSMPATSTPPLKLGCARLPQHSGEAACLLHFSHF